MTEKIKFYKYQGAGNDFILIDNRKSVFDRKNEGLVRQLCHRRYGIGADGLMLLQKHDTYDFEMVYYNADGKEATMCGNGGRCIVAFARDLQIINHKTVFLAVDGIHHATIVSNKVDLEMQNVSEISQDGEAFVLNTGSPHYVIEVENLQQLNVYQEGQRIRNNTTYRSEGINVNFIEKEEKGYFLRTFERGVEDETLACGTGATAAAIVTAIKEKKTGHVQVSIRVMGGQLLISFYRSGDSFSDIHLEGEANFVFSGQLNGFI